MNSKQLDQAAVSGAARGAACIGVLCIDIATSLGKRYGERWSSYIAASYVKYVEGAGGCVVPIWIGRDRAYYERTMRKINGVVLPGGAVFIDDADLRDNLRNDCVKSASHIYELAVEKNKKGEYFPIWGICLGFQLLLINAADSKDVRCDCQPMFQALPLKLAKDYRESVWLKQLPDDMAEDMQRVPFACHQHRFCITEDNLGNHGIRDDWHVLATCSDAEQLSFVTLIEHRKYPFFGSQFHPERAAHEQLFAKTDNCASAHVRCCIEKSQYLANVFLELCRRNGNRFDSNQEMQRHLIWNWNPEFTGKWEDSNWVQCYLFEKDIDYPREAEVTS
ncbi:gamma-glutamyl hydrolase [Scaptodrosophila lebanonensis]|uniref:folate gamma-glutamyl hydrolase n=1 Tax=Drosophila lebanonensis TaxID=7225 RepID=A0A6J2UBB5_DROLE|nr:gamma-glutamyl hydrolase [Scaptodrosophila lebanonensis]